MKKLFSFKFFKKKIIFFVLFQLLTFTICFYFFSKNLLLSLCLGLAFFSIYFTFYLFLKYNDHKNRIRTPIKFIRSFNIKHNEIYGNKKKLKGAEIGVADGSHAEDILNYLDLEKFYLIDPYQVYEEGDYKFSDQTYFDKQYKNLKIKFKNYNNVEILRKTSKEAVNEIPNKTLDFVYIDGNHQFEEVYEDLNLWFPKIKDNGFLCGDDYGKYLSGQGVFFAVNKFVRENKLILFKGDDFQFYFTKNIDFEKYIE